MFKLPKKNISDNMWLLMMAVQEKVDREKSPEQEICQKAINKCIQDRDHLLDQLSMQLNN